MQQREEASSLPPAEDVHENGLSQSQAAGHNHQVEEDRDLLTIAQQEEIDSQIAASQPLVGPLEPLSMLLQAYKDNPEKGFVEGVEDLARRYARMRRIRRDGNCFYRAFLFAYLAGLVEEGIEDGRKGEEKEGGGGKGRKRGRKKEWERFSQTVKDSKAWLLTVGYEEVAIDIFWEVFVEEVRGKGGKDGNAPMEQEEGLCVGCCRRYFSPRFRPYSSPLTPLNSWRHSPIKACRI